MTRVTVASCLAVMALLGGLVFTQEATTDKRSKDQRPATPSSKAKPAIHKVEKKPFKIELAVEGILGAEETAEIRYRSRPTIQPPPSQGPVIIRTIVRHGAKVKKGDLLVTFDGRKIDEALADLETESKMLATNLKLAEEELPLFQKSAPVELAIAETAKLRADESLKYFLEVGRPEAEKRANFSVKSAKFYLETELEELRQLQKMYKANDLTEDTEKIILRRQEHYIEMAQFFYQYALIQQEYTMKFSLPHQLKDLTENQVKQTLQLEKARVTLAPMARQKEQSLAKMRFDQDKVAKRLEKLNSDRAALTIYSPMEGVVYHGKFHKGRWTAGESLENKLVPDGSVQPDEVFLTVVKPRPMAVHLSVAEKDVHWLKPGLQGKAKVPYRPDRKLPVRVTRRAPLPASPAKFNVQVALELAPYDADLMPGMACTVKFVPYAKQEAIAIPVACLHEEDDGYVVYVVSGPGKHQKRTVTVGPSDATHTEILTGLREGEDILVERPHAQAPDTSKSPTPAKEKGEAP